MTLRPRALRHLPALAHARRIVGVAFLRAGFASSAAAQDTAPSAADLRLSGFGTLGLCIVRLARALSAMPPGTTAALGWPRAHEHDEIGALVRSANDLLCANTQALARERELSQDIEAMEAQYHWCAARISSPACSHALSARDGRRGVAAQRDGVGRSRTALDGRPLALGALPAVDPGRRRAVRRRAVRHHPAQARRDRSPPPCRARPTDRRARPLSHRCCDRSLQRIRRQRRRRRADLALPGSGRLQADPVATALLADKGGIRRRS